MTTRTWSSTGQYEWTVPHDVTSITIQAWGAGGAGGEASDRGSGAGGNGGYLKTQEVSVTPGETYTIWVGGGGGDLTGYYNTPNVTLGGDGWYIGGDGSGGAGGGGGATVFLDSNGNLIAVADAGGGGMEHLDDDGTGLGSGGGGARGGNGPDGAENGGGSGFGGDGGTSTGSADGGPGGQEATVNIATETTGGGNAGGAGNIHHGGEESLGEDGTIQIEFTAPPPLAPTLYSLTFDATVPEMYINWDPAEDWATGYEVHRSTTPGFTPDSGTLIATKSGYNNQSHTDTGISVGQTYHYKVIAFNGTGSSGPSNQQSDLPAGYVQIYENGSWVSYPVRYYNSATGNWEYASAVRTWDDSAGSWRNDSNR